MKGRVLMPSINGIEIKDVQEHETDRGIAYEGKLFINENEIGFFENKGNGGSTNVVILEGNNREDFRKRMLDYYTRNPARFETEEEFIEELMNLNSDLKVYIENAKGKILLAAMSYTRMTPTDEIPIHDLMPTYYLLDNDNQIKELLDELAPPEYKVYRSLEDFDVL